MNGAFAGASSPATARKENSSMFRYGLVIGLIFALPVFAERSARQTEKAPPGEIAAPIAALLQDKAIEINDGDKTLFEVWLRKEIPLKAKPADEKKALGEIKETEVLGVVRIVAEDRRDYRDDEAHPGVYTMRLGIQPQDGNHLGTAEFNWFAILVPAAADKDPAGLASHDELAKASSADTATEHPVIFSLRPTVANAEPLSMRQPAEDHESIVLQVPVAGGDPATVRFELVISGHGHL
jgi:hypothetical protein